MSKQIELSQVVELVMWESVRRDCKYPKEDNNEGFIYGLNLIDIQGEGDIIEVQWFKTNCERNSFIDENNLRIVDEY
tara:strand:- start:729 stop:959 length:231 start_codon:yes stop_codon:yes gene_type:complete